MVVTNGRLQNKKGEILSSKFCWILGVGKELLLLLREISKVRN